MSIDGEQPDEIELARVALEALPNIWSKDLNNQIHLSVRAAVRQVYPAKFRLWWHSVSFLFFCVSVMAFSYDQPIIGEALQMFWAGSFLGHATFALIQRSKRSTQIANLEEALLPEVRRLVEEKKQTLRGERPFSGGKRKGGAVLGYRGQISPFEAEELCAEWMALLGEENVTVTRKTNDGGVDVTSERCVAQVKNYSGSVGVREVRELMGAAAVDGRTPVFFTSGTYTRAALDFSVDAGVLLFKYSVEDGTLDGVNSFAIEALEDSSVETVVDRAGTPVARSVEEFLQLLQVVSVFVTRNPARLILEAAHLEATIEELETIPAELSAKLDSLEGYDSIGELSPHLARGREKLLELIEAWGFNPNQLRNLEDSQLATLLSESIESPKFQPGLDARLKEYFSSRELPVKSWTEVSACFTVLYELAGLVNAMNEAHEPFSEDDNQYWREILAIGPEFQTWISMAEDGVADHTAGVILRKRFDGLIELWEESVGLESGTVTEMAQS